MIKSPFIVALVLSSAVAVGFEAPEGFTVVTLSALEIAPERDLPIVTQPNTLVFSTRNAQKLDRRSGYWVLPKRTIGGWETYIKGDVSSAELDTHSILFVTNDPRTLRKDAHLIFDSLGLLPAATDRSGTGAVGSTLVYVTFFPDAVFLNGTDLAPIVLGRDASARRYWYVTQYLRGSRPAGAAFYPGIVRSAETSAGPAYVFLPTDAGAYAEQANTRPVLRRPPIVAWSPEFLQYSPARFDEYRVVDDMLVFVQNTGALASHGGRDSRWFESSFHCPHYDYQLSLLHPVSDVPVVLTSELLVSVTPERLTESRVRLSLHDASGFDGKVLYCKRFSSLEDIKGWRFGRFRGELTKPEESGSGDDYLAASRMASDVYWQVLLDLLRSRRSFPVEVESRLQVALDGMQASDRAVASQEPIGIGGELGDLGFHGFTRLATGTKDLYGGRE